MHSRPEEVHPAQPARKRFTPHCQPGRGDASLPPAPLCSLHASLTVQALVPSHMSPQQSSRCVFLCGYHSTVNMLPLHRSPMWLPQPTQLFKLLVMAFKVPSIPSLNSYHPACILQELLPPLVTKAAF